MKTLVDQEVVIPCPPCANEALAREQLATLERTRVFVPGRVPGFSISDPDFPGGSVPVEQVAMVTNAGDHYGESFLRISEMVYLLTEFSSASLIVTGPTQGKDLPDMLGALDELNDTDTNMAATLAAMIAASLAGDGESELRRIADDEQEEEDFTDEAKQVVAVLDGEPKPDAEPAPE